MLELCPGKNGSPKHCLPALIISLLMYLSSGCGEGEGWNTGSGQEGYPKTGSDKCRAPQNVSADYIFDTTEERGRIKVSWEESTAGESGPVNIRLDIEGVETELGTVKEPDACEYISESTVQDSNSRSEGVDLEVGVEISCRDGMPQSAAQGFELEDPFFRCPVPDIETIGEDPALYYECAELWAEKGEGCGEDGYFIGYGKKYAERFYYKTRPLMSQQGKIWIDETLVCLQEELKTGITIGSSCGDIYNYALDTHPYCYVASGFCDSLAQNDYLLIFLTIDMEDIKVNEAGRLFLELLIGCMREGGKSSDGSVNPEALAEAKGRLEEMLASGQSSEAAEELLGIFERVESGLELP